MSPCRHARAYGTLDRDVISLPAWMVSHLGEKPGLILVLLASAHSHNRKEVSRAALPEVNGGAALAAVVVLFEIRVRGWTETIYER